MTEQNRKISFNSFFAGIGGFDIALERQGMEAKLQCEVNSFCQDILKKHWPQVPLETDITKIQSGNIPNADIWCGGFPCQDVSVARGAKGRDGLKGKNSGLFFPFAKIISDHLPRVLLIENVTGLLSSHNGQDFRIVLETLSKMGYSVAWRVMNSRYFGAPQSRPRVFISAALGNPELAVSVLYENQKGAKPKNKRKEFLTPNTCPKSGATVAEVAYCLAATSGRHTGTDWSRTYVSYESEVRRLTPTECEGIQGFPKGWTLNENLNDTRQSDIDSPRYHALGNAVAVPVVEWIAKRLNSQLKNNTKQLSEENISNFFNDLASNHPDFNCKSLRKMKLSDLHLSITAEKEKLKWQSGGVVSGDICWDIKAPEAPAKPIQKKLIDVIEQTYPDDKYFISENAASGILRRVNSQNRTLFGPMHDALLKMVKTKDVA